MQRYQSNQSMESICGLSFLKRSTCHFTNGMHSVFPSPSPPPPAFVYPLLFSPKCGKCLVENVNPIMLPHHTSLLLYFTYLTPSYVTNAPGGGGGGGGGGRVAERGEENGCVGTSYLIRQNGDLSKLAYVELRKTGLMYQYTQ